MSGNTTNTRSTIPIHHVATVTRSVKGTFRNFKTAILILAYAVYFGLPWLPWARENGPSQAILFDLSQRKFYLFNLTVFPQDIFWLAVLLVLAAVILFFATGLVGRAWCGYFCFQTLWTDAFIWIEHFIQGERNARLRLKKQIWNIEKIFKIGASHSLMLILSGMTALTFVSYFIYAPQLTHDFFTGNAPSAAYTTFALLTLTTYIAGGLLRESICTVFCPYARFQGVMYEETTLAVAYDAKRGEGLKGRIIPIAELKAKAARNEAGYGDCIDCGYCVQVCPTGIDIRNGLQYQCISCGLCIDACNTVMDSMNYPRGLIRYDSERNLAAVTPTQPKVVWKNFKTIGYGIAILVAITLLTLNVWLREMTEVSVEQVRQPLFTLLSDGSYRNRYQMHIVNKTEHKIKYRVTLLGIPQTALDMGSIPAIEIAGGRDLWVNLKVNLSVEQAAKTKSFVFLITPNTQLGLPKLGAIKIKANFSSAAL